MLALPRMRLKRLGNFRFFELAGGAQLYAGVERGLTTETGVQRADCRVTG